MDLPVVDVCLRLVVALVLGGAVGIERERASRGAGVRTVALVSMGSALFTMAGAYGFADEPGTRVSDPTRVAAQVATGVGFIGAGAIIRQGTSVIGVTTAATVWMAAALGVLVAAGGYAAATIGTVLTLVVLVGLRLAKPLAWRLGQTRSVLEVEYDRGHGTLRPVLDALDETGAALEDLDIDDRQAGIRRVIMRVRLPRGTPVHELVAAIEEHPDVHRVTSSAGEE
ncbi:MAG: MgtC/SapB family protein [Acidimicrobiales bacterium]